MSLVLFATSRNSATIDDRCCKSFFFKGTKGLHRALRFRRAKSRKLGPSTSLRSLLDELKLCHDQARKITLDRSQTQSQNCIYAYIYIYIQKPLDYQETSGCH